MTVRRVLLWAGVLVFLFAALAATKMRPLPHASALLELPPAVPTQADPMAAPVDTVAPTGSAPAPIVSDPPRSPAGAGPIAVTSSQPTRGEPLQIPTTIVLADITPAPDSWGRAGSTIPGRCTQFELLLSELAPPGGWDVARMSRLADRESACCPQLLHETGWQPTQGGDRGSSSCVFSHVAERDHRSDVGLLQVNGINYDPARCGVRCVVAATLPELGNPVTNITAAAELCAWWRAAGSSCYRPWS